MPKGSEKLEMKIILQGKKKFPANQYQPWADCPALVGW